MKDLIFTKYAPAPIGPYSQAVKASGETLYLSGQIPLNADGNLAGEDLATQTRTVLENLKSVLEAGGMTLDNVVKVNIYMLDLGKFAELNEIYGEYFGDSKPARATVEVSRLPKDVLIEMDCIAVK